MQSVTWCVGGLRYSLAPGQKKRFWGRALEPDDYVTGVLDALPWWVRAVTQCLVLLRQERDLNHTVTRPSMSRHEAIIVRRDVFIRAVHMALALAVATLCTTATKKSQ